VVDMMGLSFCSICKTIARLDMLGKLIFY
jgi:hypothetical protein